MLYCKCICGIITLTGPFEFVRAAVGALNDSIEKMMMNVWLSFNDAPEKQFCSILLVTASSNDDRASRSVHKIWIIIELGP